LDAGDWDRRWRDSALHGHGEPGEVVVDVVAQTEPGTALDLGCGAGRHAVWLAERGWTVTAVDFSEEALRQAHAHADERGVSVDWVSADVTRYDAGSESFDLVLVAYVHVPPDEWPTVLDTAARAVAPGGVLVVVGHDRANVGTGAPGPTNPDLLHVPSDIARDLPASLTVERAEQFRRTAHLHDGGEAEAVDALVVARRPAA
jgi:ubiquinone/menaquinone biosynthesis C-methylase UbiE